MKRLWITSVAVIFLAGCVGGPLKLERIWPDGASVTIKELDVQVSMSGAGNARFKELSWIGTNGFPLPPSPAVTNMVPSGTLMQVK